MRPAAGCGARACGEAVARAASRSAEDTKTFDKNRRAAKQRAPTHPPPQLLIESQSQPVYVASWGAWQLAAYQKQLTQKSNKYYTDSDFVDLLHQPYHVDFTDDEIRTYCHD